MFLSMYLLLILRLEEMCILYYNRLGKLEESWRPEEYCSHSDSFQKPSVRAVGKTFIEFINNNNNNN